jgi:hypothetical protein
MKQITRNFLHSAVALATASLLAACGGGDSSAPALTAQTITFGTVADKVFSTATSALAATASSGLAVTLASLTPSYCTVSGSTLTIVAAGSCQVKATQAGNTTFAAATDVTNTFNITKAAQAITFASPGSQTIGTAAPALSATGGASGSAVTIASSTASICTVSGSALTLVAAGNCTLTASQAGNTNYNAATDVVNTFAVAAAPVANPGSTGTCTAPCIDFSSATVGVEAFGDPTSAAVEADPALSSNKVVKFVKSATSQVWAGATVYADATAKTITAIDASKGITLRVYSSAIGEPFLVKLESGASGAANQEVQVLTTKANAWETLSFTYTAGSYSKVSVFPGFGSSANKTYYFDELKYTAAVVTPVVIAGFSKVSFDESTAPGLIEFGTNGGGPAIVVDPAGGTNKVAKIFKYVASEQWAGTTVTTIASNNSVGTIGFTAAAKTMTARVWSPAIGVRVRLKVENAANGGISTETDALTTKSEAWETLTFNFANPGTSPPNDPTKGTAALDLTKVYDKVSIFFDFGLGAGGYGAMPANRIYYFDDLTFVAP